MIRGAWWATVHAVTLSEHAHTRARTHTHTHTHKENHRNRLAWIKTGQIRKNPRALYIGRISMVVQTLDPPRAK